MSPEEFAYKVIEKYGREHLDKYGCGIIKLNKPVPVRYSSYDEEYECPITNTDDVFGIEIINDTDFELKLENGIVNSDDITERDLDEFFKQL